jgi:hypothetical protein
VSAGVDNNTLRRVRPGPPPPPPAEVRRSLCACGRSRVLLLLLRVLRRLSTRTRPPSFIPYRRARSTHCDDCCSHARDRVVSQECRGQRSRRFAAARAWREQRQQVRARARVCVCVCADILCTQTAAAWCEHATAQHVSTLRVRVNVVC